MARSHRAICAKPASNLHKTHWPSDLVVPCKHKHHCSSRAAFFRVRVRRSESVWHLEIFVVFFSVVSVFKSFKDLTLVDGKG